jgi:hypothetical protein
MNLATGCPVPRKLKHCQGYAGMRWIFATKLRYSATVTCADGYGWPCRAGLYASDLLAGHSSGAAIELEAPQVRACRYLRSGWHRTPDLRRPTDDYVSPPRESRSSVSAQSGWSGFILAAPARRRQRIVGARESNAGDDFHFLVGCVPGPDAGHARGGPASAHLGGARERRRPRRGVRDRGRRRVLWRQ